MISKKHLYLLTFLCLIVISGCRKQRPDDDNIPTEPSNNGFAVSSVLQSNMVIQHDHAFKIWGNAPAGTAITVKVSWNNTINNTSADASGYWTLSIPPAAINAASQTITCSCPGFKDIVLDNVLIGDVWICSGQSNMVMPLDAIAPFGGVTNYQAEIAAANYPDIRMLTISEDSESNPVAQLSNPAKWQACAPQTAAGTSAIAYYFARRLQTTLQIPIGIIISAVNGSNCEWWTNAAAFKLIPGISGYNYGQASTYYNGMINPLTGLSIKGFIWYQGENNQHMVPASDYTLLNAALIKGWRQQFNDTNLPFYLVQLTPFAEDYNDTSPPGGNPTSDYLAIFREAQAGVVKTEPGTGMAVTMDVGEADNHHPKNKKPVGERLAMLALKNTYGQNVQCYGPQYASYLVNGSTATVSFVPGTANGLNTINAQPLNQLFFVAGTDHVFRKGTARIEANDIVITAPADTPLPIQAIRYAFTNAVITNLQNSDGLPMEPFRTDNWDF